MNFQSRKVERPALNVAPLIDMVLLLLIFFAISSSFVVQSGVKVELPEAGSAAERPKKELSVTIGSDGTLYFGQARTTLQELPELLKTSLARRQTTEILIIKADRNVLHGTVVQVMDVARAHGVSRLAIATRGVTSSTGEASRPISP